MARTVAPIAITPSTSSELVPALASTAGIVNTPVPMMLPMTRPVADVSPRARAFSWLRGDSWFSWLRGDSSLQGDSSLLGEREDGGADS
jgi:hypothetical protein